MTLVKEGEEKPKKDWEFVITGLGLPFEVILPFSLFFIPLIFFLPPRFSCFHRHLHPSVSILTLS